MKAVVGKHVAKNGYRFNWYITPTYPPTVYSLAVPPFDIVVRNNTLAITASGDEATDERTLRERAEAVALDVARCLSYELASPFDIEFRNRDLLAEDQPIPANAAPISGGIESVVYDPAGRVISTAQQQELKHQETQRRLTDLSRRTAADTNLRDMLVHWSRYVSDFDGHLHALYDVLQVAERLYGGRKTAGAELGMSDADLRELGRISNDPAVLNGRHPGQAPGPHRIANATEVSTCERVARGIIEKYASKVVLCS